MDYGGPEIYVLWDTGSDEHMAPKNMSGLGQCKGDGANDILDIEGGGITTYGESQKTL